ncbi:MAG: hypothetical protein ACRDI2_07020, partial [Chloroflexota bacterium]
IWRDLGDTGDIGLSLTILGLVAGAAGDCQEARALHTQGLAIQRRVGNVWGTALALEGLAAVVATEHPPRALRLAGAADALRRAINRPLPPAARPLWDDALAPAHQALGAATAASAWAEGQALSLEQALAEVEEAADLPLPDTAEAPPRVEQRFANLHETATPLHSSGEG